jgi:hypothetical protein
VCLTALVVAFAWLIQPAWENERAHYALVRALSAGKPYVDDSMSLPELRTIDVTRLKGHTYAAKAPGLAAASLPPYLVLRAAGAETTGNPTRLVWGLHLWSIVIPAAILLLLVRQAADGVVPGFGTISALSLGAATLILPFSTLFFVHVLSATLGFAAFRFLVHEREARSLWLIFAGGLASGLAFTVEYSLGLVALALGFLVLAARDRIRRGTAYTLGVVTGAVPALMFNAWAFGTPFHFSYEGWHHPGSKPLPGFLGLNEPSLKNVLEILFSPGGIAPILLPAFVGAVLLWRRGARIEAIVPFAVAGLFLAFNSANTALFGGASPGPRYMIPALPFLAVPLAAAYRAIPGATLGLVVGGGGFIVAATLTQALEAWDGLVLERFLSGQYVESVGSFFGFEGDAVAAVLFLLALAVAAVAAVAATPWRVRLHRDALAGVMALGAWLVLSTQLRGLLERGTAGEAMVVLGVVLTAALIAFVYRMEPWLRPIQPSESEQ